MQINLQLTLDPMSGYVTITGDDKLSVDWPRDHAPSQEFENALLCALEEHPSVRLDREECANTEELAQHMCCALAVAFPCTIFRISWSVLYDA